MLILSFDKKRVFGKNEQKKKKGNNWKSFYLVICGTILLLSGQLGGGQGGGWGHRRGRVGGRTQGGQGATTWLATTITEKIAKLKKNWIKY